MVCRDDYALKRQTNSPRNDPGESGDCEMKSAGPYEFIGFGAINVTRHYDLIWFGDIGGPKPLGSGGFSFANTGIRKS